MCFNFVSEFSIPNRLILISRQVQFSLVSGINGSLTIPCKRIRFINSDYHSCLLHLLPLTSKARWSIYKLPIDRSIRCLRRFAKYGDCRCPIFFAKLNLPEALLPTHPALHRQESHHRTNFVNRKVRFTNTKIVVKDFVTF